jgi:hypothetical protein
MPPARGAPRADRSAVLTDTFGEIRRSLVLQGGSPPVAKWLVRIWPAGYVSPPSRFETHPSLPGGLDRNLRVPKVVPRAAHLRSTTNHAENWPWSSCEGPGGGPRRANRAWIWLAGFRAKPGKDPRTRARRSRFTSQLSPAIHPCPCSSPKGLPRPISASLVLQGGSPGCREISPPPHRVASAMPRRDTPPDRE